ncbi:hypothetical protein NDU88_003884 [Pleurodeles waltl]|uniref:Uncharacterized protein n=1 Tax=Pleurodeles waltl TaxID=8319 RepID=A0AAV7V1B9_PLEWA|nr:hypothetical protein NDU88_003884 [Pleurodeles waltl]
MPQDPRGTRAGSPLVAVSAVFDGPVQVAPSPETLRPGRSSPSVPQLRRSLDRVRGSGLRVRTHLHGQIARPEGPPGSPPAGTRPLKVGPSGCARHSSHLRSPSGQIARLNPAGGAGLHAPLTASSAGASGALPHLLTGPLQKGADCVCLAASAPDSPRAAPGLDFSRLFGPRDPQWPGSS